VSSLSVVIPATDDPSTLPACRAALAASMDPADEIIVVQRPASLSASDARNAGALCAAGDVLVFVDADVEVHPDALGRIRAAFAQDPQLTALHGSYDDSPRAQGTVSVFRNLLHHHVHQTGGGPAETFWSGLGAVRRTDFLEVGGFDGTRYPHPSIEDIELGHRLTMAGGRLRLDPTIQGTHLKRWTLRSMLWTDVARRGAPWVALQLRTRRIASTLNCSWRHRVSALVCALAPLAVLTGAIRPALALGGALVALNHAFYALLIRQLGVARGLAGVGLHGLHHLASVVALPAGVAMACAAGLRQPRRSGDELEPTLAAGVEP
jgi:GT2 family glycosyltransferase